MPQSPAACPHVEGLESRTLFAVAAAGFAESTFIGAGISRGTAMEFAPDGRLFVAEQGGDLRVIKNGQLLDTPFLTVPADDRGERGLLGVAFDPDFTSNGFVYIYWTTTQGGPHNRISRFAADAVNPDIADSASETTLVDLPNLSDAQNHNGGAIHFGSDGKLYAGVGENANASLSQNLNSPFGKLLRFNPDGSIPEDNPFFGTTSGLARATWALGLRNPFTFAVQPGTGTIYINDVGQSNFEEINEGAAGANYGWPDTEGPTNNPQFTRPVHAYGSGAISGGAFYNPAVQQFPDSFVGDYFYADFNGGFIRRLSLDGGVKVTSAFARSLGAPTDLKVGPDGTLYALLYGGRVLQYAATQGGGEATDVVPAILDTLPDSVVGGGAGEATVQVSNTGTAKARGRFLLELFSSADSTIEDNDPLLTSRIRNLAIDPGEAKTIKIRFTYPDNLPDAGPYQLVTRITSSDAGEDASNNVAASEQLAIEPPFVDLSGAFAAPLPAGLTPGKRARFLLDLTNGGNVVVRGKVQFALTAVDPLNPGTPIDLGTITRNVRIDAATTKTVRLNPKLPSTLPAGSYIITANLDSAAAFPEPDEGNNAVATSSAIPAFGVKPVVSRQWAVSSQQRPRTLHRIGESSSGRIRGMPIFMRLAAFRFRFIPACRRLPFGWGRGPNNDIS